MKAVYYERKGPAGEVLVVGDVELPAIMSDEVLVRVRASGVNPTDTKGRGGHRGSSAMPYPRIIPHQDGAGVIEDAGPGVPRSRIGERVWIWEAQWQRPFGTAAEYCIVPSHQAVTLPENTSFEEGACLGIPAITAHECVLKDGPVEGKTLLVSGGAGAVGYYAIQIAKRSGARVITSISSERQRELVIQAGADHAIDRTREDVSARVLELTSGAGVDRTIEVAFGANLAIDAAVLKRNGVIATYASDANESPALPFFAFLSRNATIHFVLVYHVSREAHAVAATNISGWLRSGQLRHSIARTYALNESAEAHQAVERGHNDGKIIITV